MDPLTIISIIAIALPLLVQLVQFIEDQVNQAKANGTLSTTTGADKKNAVLTLFNQLWANLASSGAGSKVFKIPADQLTPLLGQLIDGIVTVFNSLGIFKKTTPAT